MDVVVLKSKGRLYRIPKAPFEPMAQTCERGWGIAATETREKPVVEQIHASFMECYQKQGLVYD
jgi:hypothetical protein